MGNQFIKKIGFAEITDIISGTETDLIISMPNIHEDICYSIIDYKKRNNIKNVKIIVDNSENKYRNGFGDIKALTMLKEAEINIYTVVNNFVSFIISDSYGYFLFTQSRIHTGDDEIALNAVLIDPVSIVMLKNFFFKQVNNVGSDEIKKGLKDCEALSKEFTDKAFEEINEGISANIKEIEKEEITNVKTELDKNPPLHPDLRRRIQTYTAKVQFVELSFEGANLLNKEIKMPEDLFPFKDEKIRKSIIARMKLFNDKLKIDEMEPLLKLREQIKDARKPLSALTSRKGKNVIKKEEKVEFLKAIDNIKKNIPKAKTQVVEYLDNEILNSIDRIKVEIKQFLIENPPDDIKEYSIETKERKINNYVNEIIIKMHIPEARNLLDNISININFYDLTYEDFKDGKLLEEFTTKKIMTDNDVESIVNIKKAFEAKI